MPNPNHPLAQSKWHGIGLNMRRYFKDAHELHSFAEEVRDAHEYHQERHERQAAHVKELEGHKRKDTFFSLSKDTLDSARKELARREKKVQALHHVYHGLLHKPVDGSHDEWEGAVPQAPSKAGAKRIKLLGRDFDL
jgi:hypothetical protein